MTSADIERWRQVASTVEATVDAAGPYRLFAPASCAGWTRREVLDHLIASTHLIAAAIDGGSPDPSVRPGELGTAYRAAADRLTAAVSAPGGLEGTLALPCGDLPAADVLRSLTADHVLFVWDLARGSGLILGLDDEIILGALESPPTDHSPRPRPA